MARHAIFVVASIDHYRDADLPHVAHATDAVSALLRGGECRQEQRGQDGDDGNDYKKFYQCEPTTGVGRAPRGTFGSYQQSSFHADHSKAAPPGVIYAVCIR